MSRRENKARALAQDLQARGDVDGAVKAFLEAGAPLEAAAALAHKARYGEAGRVLVSRLPKPPEQAGLLGGEERKIARMAASYLARAADVDAAVTLFIALGENAHAIELLERSGRVAEAQELREGGGVRRGEAGATRSATPAGAQGGRERALALERAGKLELAAQIYVQQKLHGDAGRVLAALGQLAQAAEMFEKGTMAYEAAACYLRAGDTERGLSQLLRVPKSDPRYRKAAMHAIHLAGAAGRLSFQVEHFLGGFILPGPESADERQSFRELAELYLREGMFENARDATRRILARFPDDVEAKAKLQEIEVRGTKGSDVYRRIGDEDSAFAGERILAGGPTHMELLPGLPALPEPPPLPGSLAAHSGEDLTGPVPHAARATHETSYLSARRGAVAPESRRAPVLRQSEHRTGPAQRTQHGGAAGFAIIPPLTAPALDAPASAPPPAEATSSPANRTVMLEPQPSATERPLGGEPAATFEVGGIVDGRYRLEAQLGVGGSAVVFRAFDQELDERIALKVFLAEIPDPELQAQSLARFKQELKLNRQLLHPNILRLYDIGMSRGRRYISMELLVGRGLDEILSGPPLPIGRAAAYLVQTCRALQAAHERNVIHRDIKPQNIFVTDDDVVKVMDFGIAKQTGTGNLTKAGMMAGTPHYMSPEQINDFSSVGPSADLYSLGVVAYHMLTGSLPFDHDELMPLLMMHVSQRPRPPRELRPELPEELDQLVMRLLEKKPAQRIGSALELARALQRIAARA